MNIPTSLIVVLLVVAWLVVLVPMVARRRERVPQAEPATAGFRVLRRASASLRRRPRRGAKEQPVTESSEGAESPSDARTEALVSVGGGAESQPADAAEEWAATQAQRPSTAPKAPAPFRDAPVPTAPAGFVTDDQDEVTHSRGDVSRELSTHYDSQDDDGQDDDAVDDGNGVYLTGQPPMSGRSARWLAPNAPAPAPADEHGADLNPGPMSAPNPNEMSGAATIPDEVDEREWAEHVAAAPTGPAFVDVDDEQLRPIPRRPGRGGFDPEAAEATRAYRYQQRRRVTLILLVATVAFTVAAIFVVGWLWVGAAVSLALLVGYLGYLRRQVRIEATIRQRRMERLQRARQIRPEYARAPRRARAGMSAVTPGRTVVDLDDDDPAFDDLDEYQEPITYRRAAGQ
jgi:hypothetical protein